MLTKTRFNHVNLKKKFKGTQIPRKVLQMLNMRTDCNAAHVKSVLWLLLNMLQHVLGNNLQFNFRARQIVNKETPPPHWRLLLKACFRKFRKSFFHEIQVSLNFLFKFTRLNFILVNIKPVEFHLI